MESNTKKALRDIAAILEKSIIEDNSINIGGSVIQSQVAHTMTNSTNIVSQQPEGDRKKLLETLDANVRLLLEKERARSSLASAAPMSEY